MRGAERVKLNPIQEETATREITEGIRENPAPVINRREGRSESGDTRTVIGDTMAFCCVWRTRPWYAGYVRKACTRTLHQRGGGKRGMTLGDVEIT